MPPAGTPTLPPVERVGLVTESRITVRFSHPLQETPPADTFILDPPAPIQRVRREGRRRVALIGGPFDMRAPGTLSVAGQPAMPVLPDGILDRYRTRAALGFSWLDERQACVRLFHPRGSAVTLLAWEDPAGDPVAELPMELDSACGCWSVVTERLAGGMLYGFRVEGPADANIDPGAVFCDPYGWLVAKSPGWPVRMLSVIPEREITALPPVGHLDVPARDLMIYECHVKDITQRSEQVPEVFRGRYMGVRTSGFAEHVLGLGLNAVEFLPLHAYDDREPPFGSPSNLWNETATNHWGYMSVQFFAPEPRYTTGADPGHWIGTDSHGVHQVRRMVRHLHERGLAAILDVVYNHVGNYGQSPLRRLDPWYWLRVDGHGRPTSASGCGNDFWTERPMARRMLVDSLKHWSRFYGFDGFRFDLAGLIDDAALDTISEELRAEHPGVHLIAEPWGGRYDKRRFAVRGWAAWNDTYRDALRGHDAVRQHGFLLSGNGVDLHTQLRGHVKQDGGPFEEEWQSVNYLASHDYYNLGDFLRIATRAVGPRQKVTLDRAYDLPESLLLRYRLGLFLLFSSRGMLMLHQGDEWARPKIITGAPDPSVGRYVLPRKLPGELDRDSYNRDDETNWLDWEALQRPDCARLRDYLAGMARIRMKHPALRLARHANSSTLPGNGGRVLALQLQVPGDHVLVLANLDPLRRQPVELPRGVWVVMADEQQADPAKPHGRAREEVEVLDPLTARLLVKRDP